MKETETYLTAINCSLKQAIELPGRIGQGMVRVGTVEPAAETEVDPDAQLILRLFEGHWNGKVGREISMNNIRIW